MGKKLSILIPHFNEGVEVIKPLLDSIAIQKNVDLDAVEVIICSDGPDAVDLPQEFLDSYHLDIKHYREPKGGVSRMRNAAFNYSSGEYVMWCDADDKFYHCLAFYLILNETTTPMTVNVDNTVVEYKGYDALYSVFIEEGRHPQTKEVMFINRQDGFQFVHGKVFKSEFIRKNDIHFFDECTIHEDNVLNLQVSASTRFIKWCPNPFYVWTWNDNSVCRRDPLYIKKTYIDLIKSSDCSLQWLLSKAKFDKAKETIASITYDAYYTMCHPSWKEIGTKEYRDRTEKYFADYFKKYENIWNETPKEVKMAVSNAIRQRVVMEGMEMETETLDQFLKRIQG